MSARFWVPKRWYAEPLDHVERFLTGGVARPVRRPMAGPNALTDRERAGLRLAVQGHSAPEVGRRLFISERTVESHLANIYAKLGIASKVELARHAADLAL